MTFSINVSLVLEHPFRHEDWPEPWVSIKDTARHWFALYLFPPRTFGFGVQQGPILGLIVFSIYTHLLSEMKLTPGDPRSPAAEMMISMSKSSPLFDTSRISIRTKSDRLVGLTWGKSPAPSAGQTTATPFCPASPKSPSFSFIAGSNRSGEALHRFQHTRRRPLPPFYKSLWLLTSYESTRLVQRWEGARLTQSGPLDIKVSEYLGLFLKTTFIDRLLGFVFIILLSHI